MIKKLKEKVSKLRKPQGKLIKRLDRYIIAKFRARTSFPSP